MNIALDFDETFIEDPLFWAKFVSNAHARGHTVTFVTYRPAYGSNSDIELEAECLGIDIVYTEGKQKQHCFDADVWIDDSPETVVNYNMLNTYRIGCEKTNDRGQGE